MNGDGRLFYASHDSLRDDCHMSIREITTLVELAYVNSRRYRLCLTGPRRLGRDPGSWRPGLHSGRARRIGRHRQCG
jgi:hypothetical protein